MCRSCSSRQLPSLVRANTGELADAERHVSECQQRCHRALFSLTRCGIARAGGCNEDSARAVWSLAFGRAVLFDVRGMQPRTRPTLRWTGKAPGRWYLPRREIVHLHGEKRDRWLRHLLAARVSEVHCLPRFEAAIGDRQNLKKIAEKSFGRFGQILSMQMSAWALAIRD